MRNLAIVSPLNIILVSSWPHCVVEEIHPWGETFFSIFWIFAPGPNHLLPSLFILSPVCIMVNCNQHLTITKSLKESAMVHNIIWIIYLLCANIFYVKACIWQILHVCYFSDWYTITQFALVSESYYVCSGVWNPSELKLQIILPWDFENLTKDVFMHDIHHPKISERDSKICVLETHLGAFDYTRQRKGMHHLSIPLVII